MSEPKYALYDWVFKIGVYNLIRPSQLTGFMQVNTYQNKRQGPAIFEFSKQSLACRMYAIPVCLAWGGWCKMGCFGPLGPDAAAPWSACTASTRRQTPFNAHKAPP